MVTVGLGVGLGVGLAEGVGLGDTLVTVTEGLGDGLTDTLGVGVGLREVGVGQCSLIMRSHVIGTFCIAAMGC